ncbi:MAG TPA: hypothetical protein VJ729_14240 [Nitrososphaeraceae archaeon]|nr:hypothetical protein [Nitrososphaeraceae archaeon]
MASSDKNSDKSSFSVPPLFKEYPSYAYMYAIEKGQLLTLEEKILINRILIGCSKLIYSSYLQGAKNTAKAYSKLSKKDLASTYSIIHLTMRVKDRSKFRPSNIRKKLPEENKDIQPADLSDILKSLSSINLVTKTQKDTRKRGSPSKNGQEDPSERGMHSFYQPAEYFEVLKQVIAKPMARKLIFGFLLESNLIHKWLDFNCLLALYVSKFSNIDNIKNIDKAVGVIQDELKDEKLYREVASLTDKRLESIAHKFAISALQHFEEYEEMFTNLYLIGGIYFDA